MDPNQQSLASSNSVQPMEIDHPKDEGAAPESISGLLVPSFTIQNNSSVKSKMSPLKHVTPILHKYKCQRQALAKTSKPSTVTSKEKNVKTEQISSNRNAVEDLSKGMVSLDAALRVAEKHIAGNKDQIQHEGNESSASNCTAEHTSDNVDTPQEQKVSGTTSQATPGNVRTPQQRKRNIIVKKQLRLQKDLEHAVPLAVSDLPEIVEDKSHIYAQAYFLKVRERLEKNDNELHQKFLKVVGDFGNNTCSVTDLYHQVMDVLSGHPDLCQEFLGFLLPDQALQCGRFMEHLGLTEAMSFFRMLEVQFSKQPHHLRKIFSCWERLVENPLLTLEGVRNAIVPLLRGNTLIIDSFLDLLPGEKPPDSKMTDFDQVIFEDVDSEHSGDEETYERVEIPPEKEDAFGGDTCRCCCHDGAETAFKNRLKHCVPCGIKFISGKVFLQTEHGLRPVRIDFNSGTSSANIKRLSADTRKVKRCKKGRPNAQGSNKAEEPRPTTETDDESAGPSKGKSPRGSRPKANRQPREKASTSRATTGRKSSTAKINLSVPVPNMHDQEAQSALKLNEVPKSATLDFSVLSEVLKQDRQKLTCNNSVDDEERNYGKEQNTKDNEVYLQRCGESSPSKPKVAKEETSPIASVAKEANEENQEASWTRDEDRIILQAFQAEPDNQKFLKMISKQLTHRSVKEIENRFQILMSLIQQMR